MSITGREIIDRLEAVERENAELRRLLKHRTLGFAVALGCFAVVWFMFMSVENEIVKRIGGEVVALENRPFPRIVEAEKFVVKDSRGNVRATLGRTGHPTDDRHAETGLQLWTNGKQRGSLVVDGHGWASLGFQDSKEDERLSLIGESSSAGLSICDSSGDQRIDLSVQNDDAPMLILNGKSLDPRIQMGVLGNKSDSPSFFSVFDFKGQDYQFLDRAGLPLWKADR